jgi:hypothetical protein
MKECITMKTRLALLTGCLLIPLITSAIEPVEDTARTESIPLDQLGIEATKQADGEGLSIIATMDGAQLNCAFQRLEGRATPEGLWIASTTQAEDSNLIRIVAVSVGRTNGKAVMLPATGKASIADQFVRFVRPGITEEYSVSVDGVRQDFLVLEKPMGAGELCVELALSGASAKSADYGAKLIMDGSGRTLAYSRLRVTDATGRELTARMEVTSEDRLAVSVDDTDAIYPVHIDPTLSDADWVSLGSALGGPVYALVISGADLYAGGSFTNAGGVSANCIAKWNGSSWSALGSGMSGRVEALAIMGTDLYAGGRFTNAGGVTVNYIAKWNGSSWSALGSGMSGGVVPTYTRVDALQVIGSDLYVGGYFTSAGGVPANYIARWNGTSWSALGSGMDLWVNALAVIGTDLYAGGYFTTAGGADANRIAKWNGSSWSALGSGMSSQVQAPEVIGSDLYAAGEFSMAGGVSANYIARWNGTSWSALGSGVNNWVYSLEKVGSDLYAGGSFTTAGGAPANRIAKWNGTFWSALGSGLSGKVSGLSTMVEALVYDESEHLLVGGNFTMAGNADSSCIAQVNAGPPFPMTLISLTNNEATLSWPVSTLQWDLYTTTHLGMNNWTLMTNSAVYSNGVMMLSLPVDLPHSFYQLQLP